ncbi:hypothetical protein Vadar_008086 [Vaccinium darrowii]|uniref:Uncharacterized protein n=1 Tax=Vaccinium darrowii TaxID=229202 RepID=A0ACB7YTU3_9ERIC|nr:hypothetical protein Vadar_008086 [Vaccinium darrowii]
MEKGIMEENLEKSGLLENFVKYRDWKFAQRLKLFVVLVSVARVFASFFLFVSFNHFILVPRPNLSFEAQLIAGKSHDLGSISCPEQPNPPAVLSAITHGVFTAFVVGAVRDLFGKIEDLDMDAKHALSFGSFTIRRLDDFYRTFTNYLELLVSHHGEKLTFSVDGIACVLALFSLILTMEECMVNGDIKKPNLGFYMSKYFTHLVTVLERYGQAIARICPDQDKQVMLIGELSSYWKNSAQLTATTIDLSDGLPVFI